MRHSIHILVTERQGVGRVRCSCGWSTHIHFRNAMGRSAKLGKAGRMHKADMITRCLAPLSAWELKQIAY